MKRLYRTLGIRALRTHGEGLVLPRLASNSWAALHMFIICSTIGTESATCFNVMAPLN